MRAETSFASAFGGSPEGVAMAPGRVNLIGEHTDYQEGVVLPAALSVQTAVAFRKNGRAEVRAVSEYLPEEVRFVPDQQGVKGWGSYLAGVVWALRGAGFEIDGLDLAVASDVPAGAGLSSSAALEVATARAWRQANSLDLGDAGLAELCRQAENEYVGVPSGIMDQFACSVPEAGQALLLDCRSLAFRTLPLPEGWVFAVVDSGASRQLAESGYAQRVAECRGAAERLGLASLRDLELHHLDALDSRLRRRARHILTENRRVQEAAGALEAADPETFGRLMSASHQSLRDDYEVSSPALDALVEAAAAFEGCYGSRLTGAGFGGCTVSLLDRGALQAFAVHLVARVPQARVVATVESSGGGPALLG
ncbi:MAG TPA: galactokinase [Trueperaceae bacterium]